MYRKIAVLLLLAVLLAGCVGQRDASVGFEGKDAVPIIESDVLSVHLDNTFPRVVQYVWKDSGAVMYGQSQPLTQITINGEAEAPEVKFSQNADTAKYELTCKSCVLDVEMKVVGNVLEFQIVSIKEDDAFRVNTIEIPQHSIISIRSTQPNAVLATALIDADKSKCGDTFTPITASTEVSDKLFSAAYAILSTEKLAASIETNSIYDYPNDSKMPSNARHAKGANKVSNGRVKYEYTKFGGTVAVGLSSGQWTYRADQSDKIEPAPFLKVVITADCNDDNVVDWQDGAIAFRDIMSSPRGAERTPDRVAQHISFNFASDAGFPFLRALDNVKRVYYATDGLGQFVLLKGYQSEGHDSAHSDYGGNIGRRQGGKKDMNILVNEGEKWGAEIGVHLNCTESYPEAKCFSEDFADPKKRGWGWLDQSYYIYHRKDLTTGYFAERINELKQDVPGLDFIYMDVYFGDGWEGLEMARTVQQAGMDITTEFPKQIEHSAIWSHWSTDMTYGPDTSRGINSQIVRFIRNHQKDMYLKHPLLGHAEIGDFEGWQGRTNFNQFLDKVYNASLPSKYLQHFLITKWTENEIQLTDDVRVTDASGKRQIYKGDRMILDGNAYLLPWEPKTEKKLYHWNADGGTTVWTLPTAWKAETVKQYRLTDTGRVFVADLPVVDGQVTIDAEVKTPYIVYRSKAKADRKAKWGQGGVVKDPGFNDRDRGDWIVKGVVDAVSVDVDNHGRSALKVAPCRIKTAVFQKITSLKSGVYSASVWVEVEKGRRKASLIVAPSGGIVETAWTDHSFVNNAVGNSEWNRTRMQRIQVLFEVPAWKRSATITLAVEPGQSPVRFDNVRIVPAVRTQRAGFDFFEDFENVDEGWFPFVKGGAGGVTDPTTHLSELHAPYTNAGWNEKLVDDTIEGQWSLKSHNERYGMVYQTIPQTVRFVPGHKYEVSFDYQSAFEGEYLFVIGSGGGDDQKIISKTPFTQQRQTKRFTVTVTPGDDPNVWVGLERVKAEADNKSSETDFIMDNFAVRQIAP